MIPCSRRANYLLPRNSSGKIRRTDWPGYRFKIDAYLKILAFVFFHVQFCIELSKIFGIPIRHTREQADPAI
jgi:hypothetical protein